MRRGNYRSLLSVAGTPGLLPLLLSRQPDDDRDCLSYHLMLEMVRDVSYDNSLFEQQRAFQKQRILIVQ